MRRVERMAERDRARMQGVAGTWPPRAGAQAGGFVPAGVPLWAWFAERLRAWARAEAGAGRLLPWVPVAFGSGIALYFTAPREPVFTVTIVTAIACCAAAFLLRRSRFFAAAVMVAAVASGFASA